MSMIAASTVAPEWTPVLAGAVQELLTAGHTRLGQCVSDRLLHKIAQATAQRLDGRYVRQLYDGLPARIIEHLIGPAVLSKLEHSVSTQWHRGRADVTASGAPRDFLPGIDVVAALEDAPVELELVAGSGRLYDRDGIPYAFAARVAVRPTELLLLDTRLVRRRVAGSAASLTLKVVRSWITPEEVFAEANDPQCPPRAANFFGRATTPARDLAAWLERTHPKRS